MRYFVCLAAYMLSATACINKTPASFIKGEGGLLYQIIDDANTPNIGKVAYVSFTYKELTSSGKLIAGTGLFDPRPTSVFAVMPEFKGDFQTALPYLSEGDSAIIKVKSDSLNYRKGALAYDKSKYIVYMVRINKVINRQGLVDTTYPQKISEFNKEELNRQQQAEDGKISHYLAVKKLNYKRTASGIAFPADMPVVSNAGKKLYVNYTITSLDGKVYDTNNKQLASSIGIDRPYKLYKPQPIAAEQTYFPGLTEVMNFIPPGRKVSVIIPSKLAFGVKGNDADLPGYCPLLCELEILDHQ